MTDQPPASSARPKRQLTLFDSTCIILGIILGAGIYKSSPTIASCVPNVAWLFGVWLAGGLISLFGAMCYAELATAYPKEGGDYVYLTRAYGRPAGFLFAWAQLWVICPGSMGAMAYVFAEYASRLYALPIGQDAFAGQMIYASGAIVVLTLINILGVNPGKWTQNILTVVKVAGLALIIVTALFCGTPNVAPGADDPAATTATDATASAATATDNATAEPEANEEAASGIPWVSLGVAMIFVLFTYAGWQEMAYVGAEVRDPAKNIFRAMILGTVGVTVIYLLITLAFLTALGFQGLQDSEAVADDVLRLAVGDWAGRLISLLICISAAGAINGQVFTGARIYYAMGTEHKLFSWLGRWSSARGTPIRSLVIQAAITLIPVVAFAVLRMFGRSKGDFDSMVLFTGPAVWLFLFLVGIGVFVLRFREPKTPRPFRVPGYPVTPLLFVAACIFMLWQTIEYAIKQHNWESAWGIVIVLIGLGFAVADYFMEPLSANHDGDDPS